MLASALCVAASACRSGAGSQGTRAALAGEPQRIIARGEAAEAPARVDVETGGGEATSTASLETGGADESSATPELDAGVVEDGGGLWPDGADPRLRERERATRAREELRAAMVRDGEGLDLVWLDSVGPLEDAPETDMDSLRRLLPSALRDPSSEEYIDSVGGGDVMRFGDGRFLFRHQHGAIESIVYMTDETGRVLAAHALERRAQVGRVDVVGDARPELLVEQIEGDSMCCYPRSWQIFEPTRGGKFRRLLRVARSSSYGSKYLRYDFANAVRMPERGVIVVETVLFNGPGEAPLAGRPSRAGELRTYRYSAKKRRFVRARE